MVLKNIIVLTVIAFCFASGCGFEKSRPHTYQFYLDGKIFLIGKIYHRDNLNSPERVLKKLEGMTLYNIPEKIFQNEEFEFVLDDSSGNVMTLTGDIQISAPGFVVDVM